jgi:hypothetical protein
LRRILVIESVGLWIALTRQFAGRDSVQVSEASSLEMGVKIAQVEQPSLIACRPDELDRSITELASILVDAGLESIPTLCVHSTPTPEFNRDSRHGKLSTCHQDDVLAAVNAALRSDEAPGATAELEILAHYETRSGTDGEPLRGFLNLLDIDVRTLVVESSVPLEVGDLLGLSFFLPRIAEPLASGERVHVTLDCKVESCINPSNLYYTVRIKKISDESEAAFQRYVEARLTGGESLT